MFNFKKEKLYVILFFTALTVVLTWPVAWHFFSSVPSSGSDTMQVIGVVGNKANLISDQGFFRGTFNLIKGSEFTITTLYAYFQLIFGRLAGYNLLFFLSFILSGFGAYLLALYFTKNKPASLIAGIIFAFSPFHIHNALGTNVGTMHQEWLPFFALYLFRYFEPVRNKENIQEKSQNKSEVSNGVEDLKTRNFLIAGLFLLLIGFTEHQMLAFTLIFILFFFIYKLFAQPKLYFRPKLWMHIGISLVVFLIIFFCMFRSLLTITNSDSNYLDASLKAAVKYSNDSLSILIPPNFHSLWPNALLNIKKQIDRSSGSDFSDYMGYSVLIMSLAAIFLIKYLKKNKIPTGGIFFWLAVAVGFYVLSWGPYLHYKGVLDPPVKMPYYLIYQYFPFYNNIQTVGGLFVWSLLGFSMLAAWGMAFFGVQISNFRFKKSDSNDESVNFITKQRSLIFYSLVGLLIILEYLALPIKTNSLLHSSFYEKLGQDKENYSVLEVPGNTSYDFASRDLVWQNIHRKNTINGYDFSGIVENHYTFQRGTPIIRTLLYDIPSGTDGSDSDIVKSSYYGISSEILNYYNIRWIILDKEGLKGDPIKGNPNMFYPAKAYITSVVKCADVYEDDYLYACKIDPSIIPAHLFLAMDYSNMHWVGKNNAKNGVQRFIENGAGLKLVNMTGAMQNDKFDFNLKVSKPLGIKVFLNGEETYSEYVTDIGKKKSFSVDFSNIKLGENDITFGVYGADGSEIHSDKKNDTAAIYQLDME